MADVSTVRELIRLSRQANVSLYIWGVHGLGKSSLVQQTAAELGIGCVDFRCAQIEASDLRGLPDKGADGRTHFLPPAELPSSGSGILFLDELNRGSAEVLAAAFQLVLDRRIGQYQLPPDWSIVCAGNLSNGDDTRSLARPEWAGFYRDLRSSQTGFHRRGVELHKVKRVGGFAAIVTRSVSEG